MKGERLVRLGIKMKLCSKAIALPDVSTTKREQLILKDFTSILSPTTTTITKTASTCQEYFEPSLQTRKRTTRNEGDETDRALVHQIKLCQHTNGTDTWEEE